MAEPNTIDGPLFAVLLGALILATLGVLTVTVKMLLLIFAGVLFALFLNRLVRFVAGRTKLSYRVCYPIVVLLLAVLVASGVYYAGTQIVAKAHELGEQLQASTDRLIERIDQSQWLPDKSEIVSQLKTVVQDGDGILPQIMTVTGWITWSLSAAAVILFIGLYVAYDPQLYGKGVLRCVASAQRERAEKTLQALQETLARWIGGRLMSMSIVGVATTAALWILGVPLPGMLGVIAALMTFVPNVGPLLATIPQVLLAFQVGSATVLYVLLFNVALQTLESYAITPVIMRYEVSLPPALTISAQLLMAVLLGPIGMVMAAPLTLLAIALVTERRADPHDGPPQAGGSSRL